MTGEFKKGIKKKWRQLSLLAVATAVLFGLAYWWDDARTRQADQEPEAVGETAKQPAPLPDTDLGRRIDKMLSDGNYQRSLPEAPKPQPTNKRAPLPRWVGEAILYGLVGLGILAIAIMVWVLATGASSTPARSRKAFRKKAAQADAMKGMTHALAQPASKEDADRAARDGNFGEAVRLLLATALTSLARQELVRLRPWMTGREIVRDAKLAASPSGALHHLVATVEAYAFAGREIDAATYEACLRQYQLLAGAGKGAAA